MARHTHTATRNAGATPRARKATQAVATASAPSGAIGYDADPRGVVLVLLGDLESKERI